jgi:hypothetical protein
LSRHPPQAVTLGLDLEAVDVRADNGEIGPRVRSRDPELVDRRLGTRDRDKSVSPKGVAHDSLRHGQPRSCDARGATFHRRHLNPTAT